MPSEMTKEELTLLTALQPKIREAMGLMQNNDRFYCPHCRKEHTLFSGNLHDVGMDCFTAIGDMIRIPLPAPLPGQDASRTLWGMVKKNKILQERDGFHTLTCWNDGDEESEVCDGDTPYLALLKALAAQWGVEVRG